jgi:predicted dehydrogenase
MKSINRRNFLKKTSLSTASLYMASSIACSQEKEANPSGGTYMGDYKAPKLDKVRVAMIGVGARGSGHVKQLAAIEGTEIVAISDLYEDLVDRSVKNCESVGDGRHQNIKRFFGEENQWKEMLKTVKPDAVFIATNWKNHAPMAIEAMKQGAHAFVEVPLALTLEEMWDIVDTSERTQKHCMMMENVNYGRDELLYLNLCRKGIIGEILHAEAAYIHELRFKWRNKNEGQALGEHHITPSGMEISTLLMVLAL